MDKYEVEALNNSTFLIRQKIKEIVCTKPAVLTGDFNVFDQWDANTTITTKPFVLKDAYKISEKQEGVNYTFHDFGHVPADKREKIDFIFVTPQIKVKKTLIPQESQGETGFLSDHNPQLATLEF